MSKGEARGSQSEISFNVERKVSDKIISRSKKRAREEVEDTYPTLLVNKASTSTITEEPITVNVNYPSPRANNNNQNLKEIFFSLIKDIVKFCGKTIEETATSIDETQFKLKQNLNKDEYDAIKIPFK